MGGQFVAMNKIRPGAYMNFKTLRSNTLTTGTRGIVLLPMALPWAPDKSLQRITVQEFLEGGIFLKTGLQPLEAQAQQLREAFKGASEVLLWQTRTGGTKASLTKHGITFVAVNAGTFGNNITISSIVNGDSFDLVTTINGLEVDRQTLKNTDTFIPNGWFTISTSGVQLQAWAGDKLINGEDGAASNELTDLFKVAAAETWHVLALSSTESSTIQSTVKYIQELRDTQGKKVQAVVVDYPQANYEGIISVSQGYKLGDEEIPKTSFACTIAGLSAGAPLNVSNTYRVLPGATGIIGPLSNKEIEQALMSGKLVLSQRQDKAIVIEKDINTLQEFTPEKGYVFSKNRVIRCLDDIATQVTLLFERSFLGKVDNDDSGRTLFKSNVIGYLEEVQNLGGIQNFDASKDLEVLPGKDIDSVIVNLWIQVTDAMEKMYITVVVR